MIDSTAKKNTGVTIIVLGGWLIRKGKTWRTTMFEESGGLGDRLRVVAAALLYEQSKKTNSKVTIWVSGGKGQLAKIPDVPTVASVIKGELEALGVPPKAIETEEDSGTTYEQLQKLNAIIHKRKECRIALLSNEYHLPRIQAMIEYGPHLKNLKSSLESGKTILLSAERFLTDKKKWRSLIQKAYASKQMKERVAIEKKGVQDIQNGIYAYTPYGDQTIVLRKATEDDARFLYDLRNEKTVRQASFSTDLISWEDHTRWFQKKLAGTDSVIFIAAIDQAPVGQVRFDFRKDGAADINIAISQKYRGKGYGSRVIKIASEHFFAEFPKVRKIHAFIKPTNEASLKVFSGPGYHRIDSVIVKGELCIDMVFTR